VRHILITIAFASLPAAVLACPVCFGQNDSPMAWGTNAGIFFMLGVTGAVLAAFAAFFIYLMRRASAAADEPSGDGGEYVFREKGPVLHASESRFFASEPAAKRGSTRW
jgi:hypothetical protein